MSGPLEVVLSDPTFVFRAILDTLWTVTTTWGPTTGPATAAIVAAMLVGRRVWWRHTQQRMAEGARVISILAPPTVDPDGASALFANLVGLLRPGWARRVHGQPHIVWEYAFAQHGVSIQLWVPGTVPPGMAERAITAAWPGAHTTTKPATPTLPFPADTTIASVGGELRLARSEALPIRHEFPTDPIRPLLAAPAGLGSTEHAVVQILARPVTGARLRRARRAARRIRAGRSTTAVGRLLDLTTPRPRRAPSVDRQTVMENSAQDKAIVTKQRGAQYETRIRYALATRIVADDPNRAAVRDHLRGRAHAIAAAFAGFSGHNYYRRTRLRHPLRATADRHLAGGDLLSIAELAVLAHLPTDDTVPGLQRAGAQAVPPPPGIATTGENVKPIGVTDAGHERPVGLYVSDARHHLHILGATGSGKSELMGNLILADADAGRGLVVIDPKGDLVEDVLMRLPRRLGHRVVLLDADSRARPPILNPLEGEDTDRVVDNLVSIFSRVYSGSWGPRTEDILRAGLLTLSALNTVPVLTDLPELLTNPTKRHQAIEAAGDPILAGFWQWFDALSDPARAHVTAPLMNKLRGLLLRRFVRESLAGGASTVDMDDVLDGMLLLVRLGKDALGMDTARLIGSIVVARTWQAATRRARIAQRDRRDSSLYIDECHNFLHLAYPMEDMLAEARGYRLSMVLAHQYLRQLPRELEEGISTNARSKVVFNASPEDARIMARHTLPQLTEHDLSHLDRFHIAARLVLDSGDAPAFTARTTTMRPAMPGRARTIRRRSRVNAKPRPTTLCTESNRPDPRRDAAGAARDH
ncbi:helicase HerA domain-containing protein [Kutzneria buriramensis]|uniref:Uncharacterized protein DUF87 n=1 Tax=Kutzneria buriramensis TaxID=1045776 RepID=A0A3E0GV79_9PSEU|nr:DUF87 domain-containing protein [Kutzneria buriramensis]REH28658.1 uncharacterized protein DUF87 [Kutzneria buriramensis]